MSQPHTTVMAGIPAANMYLYRRIRFSVGDPAAVITVPQPDGTSKTTLILRDIEMDRARKNARVDVVACPKDFAPADGLSGDRETATAQSVAEFLRRAGVKRITADRTLPLIFADIIAKSGVQIDCDHLMGVLERRAKDAWEVDRLREAQAATERVMEFACSTIGRAKADARGVLQHDGAPLTSERVGAMIDTMFLSLGYSSPGSIVACGAAGGDCHEHGHGELRTNESIIVDIFPRSKTTYYNGDCTRTVVHGTPSETVVRMHRAVVDAKHAATRATRAGVTGEDVHKATLAALKTHGFEFGPLDPSQPDRITLQHGTGHGIGLDVHEPPLLDFGAPVLVEGDALTIEPGLYSRTFGGVRVEDLVIVRKDGCENLNKLHEGLEWK